MTARRHPFFTSARGRLLSFNLLMGVVTLLVSGVAVFGFHHASQLQEQVQRQTLNDMRGSMDLARDTANVATAAVRLSQVVGALEYKSEAERLLATQQALKHSLAQLAAAPLAQQLAFASCGRLSFSTGEGGTIFYEPPQLGEALGEYPLLSQSEAQALLLQGQCLAGAPYAVQSEADIAAVAKLHRVRRLLCARGARGIHCRRARRVESGRPRQIAKQNRRPASWQRGRAPVCAAAAKAPKTSAQWG